MSLPASLLQHIEQHPEVYDLMERGAAELVSNVPPGVTVNRVGSMFTLFFQVGPVHNYEDAKRSNTALFGKFFHHLLERGVYLPPSQFEAAFLSAAHTPQDIAYSAKAISEFSFAENAA